MVPSRVFALVLVTACSIDAGFDVPYDVGELTVQGSSYGKEAPFAYYIDVGQEAESHVSAMSSVTLSSITFDITNDSGCFDFINEITLSIESTKQGTTLERTVVATGGGPGCVAQLGLVPNGVDLKPYLMEGALITATGNGVPPTKDVSFEGNVVLHATL